MDAAYEGEKMAEELMIKINKWVDYNPRKDINAPTWFRFKHTFFENSSFYSFSSEERLSWVYILCERSKIIEDRFFTVNSEHFHRMTSFAFTVMKSACKKLEKNQTISIRTVRGRYAGVIDPVPTRQDKTEQDNTEQDNTEQEEGESAEQKLSPLFEIWNSTNGLPKTRGASPARIKSAQARWKANPDASYWEEVAGLIADSKFCQGQNERGWKATFDWFIHPETHLKVLEGKYAGKEAEIFDMAKILARDTA